MLDESWLTYEQYTAPLGVGFMVRPGHHYGPDVDGYEYTPWGTYHFADRDGVGVDRTRATGTGYTGQYPQPWADVYESLDRCPDELLLFFHHVPVRARPAQWYHGHPAHLRHPLRRCGAGGRDAPAVVERRGPRRAGRVRTASGTASTSRCAAPRSGGTRSTRTSSASPGCRTPAAAASTERYRIAGGAVLSRTTSSVTRSMREVASCTPLARSSSMRVAVPAMSRSGWLTVVRLGPTHAATGRLS